MKATCQANESAPSTSIPIERSNNAPQYCPGSELVRPSHRFPRHNRTIQQPWTSTWPAPSRPRPSRRCRGRTSRIPAGGAQDQLPSTCVDHRLLSRYAMRKLRPHNHRRPRRSVSRLWSDVAIDGRPVVRDARCPEPRREPPPGPETHLERRRSRAHLNAVSALARCALALCARALAARLVLAARRGGADGRLLCRTVAGDAADDLGLGGLWRASGRRALIGSERD